MRKLLKNCLNLLLCIGFVLSCSACEKEDGFENVFPNGTSTVQPSEGGGNSGGNNGGNSNGNESDNGSEGTWTPPVKQ